MIRATFYVFKNFRNFIKIARFRSVFATMEEISSSVDDACDRLEYGYEKEKAEQTPLIEKLQSLLQDWNTEADNVDFPYSDEGPEAGAYADGIRFCVKGLLDLLENDVQLSQGQKR